MIKKSILERKGKAILKATTALLAAVSLISMAQLSACAAATWSFWGDQEEISEEGSDTVCVATLYKGQTEQFLDMGEVTGEITWSVENPEILDISEDGELIPLKVGNTMVTLTVNQEAEDAEEDVEDTEGDIEEEEETEVVPDDDGEADSVSETEEHSYQYYISICKKKAYKAVKKARNAIGASYSQSRRMQKGYYDCSSLIWRSYSPYGILFGEEGDWAPTAADQGLWCDENDKTIGSAIDISEGKLLPGDLLFYSKNSDNGRYKKIYHVAMFEGYQVNYDEETGESVLSGTVIEADGSSVVRNTYRSEFTNSGKKIIISARPTK